MKRKLAVGLFLFFLMRVWIPVLDRSGDVRATWQLVERFSMLDECKKAQTALGWVEDVRFIVEKETGKTLALTYTVCMFPNEELDKNPLR